MPAILQQARQPYEVSTGSGRAGLSRRVRLFAPRARAHERGATAPRAGAAAPRATHLYFLLPTQPQNGAIGAPRRSMSAQEWPRRGQGAREC